MTTQQKIFRRRLRSALFYWLWLPGIVIASGLALDYALGLQRLQHEGVAHSAAIIILCAGLVLIAWAEHDLTHYGHGTSSPTMPTRTLVTRGSYHLCRHPMFLGYDLSAAATVFLTGSPAMLMISLPLMLFWQLRFLRKEEHMLALRFHEGYAHYQANTPLLIPFLPANRR